MWIFGKKRKNKQIEENKVLEQNQKAIYLNSKLSQTLQKVLEEELNIELADELHTNVINISKNSNRLNINIIEDTIQALENIYSNPVSLNAYSKVIDNLNKKFVVFQENYDEQFVAELNKRAVAQLRADQAFKDLKLIEERIHTLTILSSKLEPSNPLNIEYANELNNLEIKLNTAQYVYNTNQKVISRNTKYDGIVIKQEELEEINTRRTVTVDQYIHDAIKLKEADDSFIIDENLMDDIDNQYMVSTGIGVILDPLRQRVEHHLMQQSLSIADEEYVANVSLQSENEILMTLKELSDKIELLAVENVNNKNESMGEINRLFSVHEELFQNGLLNKQTGNNLLDNIELLLSTTPKNLVAASTLLRSTIENYCRYNSGINLTDKFRFTDDNNSLAFKFQSAKIDKEIVPELINIYKNSNVYIHNDLVKVSLTNEDVRADEILAEAKKLVEWGFTEFDTLEATKKVYERQDLYIKSRAGNVENYQEFMQLPGAKYAIKDQVALGNHLRAKGVNLESEFASLEKDVHYYKELDKYINNLKEKKQVLS